MFETRRPGHCIFDTDLGPCAMGWTSRGVDRFDLPDTREDLAARIAALDDGRPVSARPGGAAAKVVGRIRAHLAGRLDDLADVPLDLADVPPFARRVYRALRKVQPGSTTTYGDLARRAGRPGAARAVGTAMARNRIPLLVPCHRVLPAGGGLGAFSSPGGPDLKARLLHREGHRFPGAHQVGLDFLAATDRRMAKLIHRCGPYLPAFGKPGDPYDVLVLSIVHQQLSMKAAATIAGRVRALTSGDDFPTPREMIDLPDGDLRAAGLSRAKVAFMKDLAGRVHSGALDLRALARLDDDTAVETLCEVHGIGVWTAQMALMFNLGRLDVWPVGDLGLRNAAARFEGLPAAPTEREMEALGERWRPYRSLAAWYLWRTVDGGGV